MEVGKIEFGPACAHCFGRGVTVAGTPCSCKQISFGRTEFDFTGQVLKTMQLEQEAQQLRAKIAEQEAHIAVLIEALEKCL